MYKLLELHNHVYRMVAPRRRLKIHALFHVSHPSCFTFTFEGFLESTETLLQTLFKAFLFNHVTLFNYVTFLLLGTYMLHIYYKLTNTFNLGLGV